MRSDNVYPKYQTKDVIVGNKDSSVGIVTLWTKKDEILKHINCDKFNIIGQLYSNVGINYIIRNCLSNKKIRHIVMVGEDLSGSGETLKTFFEDGVLRNKIIGTRDALIDEEISHKAIGLLRTNVELIDWRNQKDYSMLNALLIKLESNSESYGDPEYFPDKKIKFPDRYPSENIGFVIRKKNIGDAWLSLLYHIMRYGCHKPSSYSDDQIELLDLMTVTNENMKIDDGSVIVDFKDYYLFTEDELDEYYAQIITSEPHGVNYTYGQRLRNHNGIDQIQGIIDELKKEKFSRRAIAFTWNVEKDTGNKNAPCLDLVQCNIQDNKLYLTGYIRSNDMVKAWVQNVYGLRRLQKLISDELHVNMGNLTTISCSAHIYESDVETVQSILENNKLCIVDDYDPRGDFIIDVDDVTKEIDIEQHDPFTGNSIDLVYGKSAGEVTRKLAMKNMIINPYHAMYLGRELQKVEYCIKNGEKYVQG
jgi:thymidylate synthase